MKDHLPYNVILIATVIAIGLMAVVNLTMQQSRFAVRILYTVPATAASAAHLPPPAAPAPQSVQQPAVPEPAQPLPEADPAPVVAQEQAPEVIVLAQFPLEINRATFEQLQLIPGIGPVTAQSIVDLRAQLGGFTHISQLLDVRGVGPSTFERITAYLYITGESRRSPQQDQLHAQNDTEYDYGYSYN